MYLDRAGLVALWRETLLAKKVLEGRTKGYTKHPQLDRFRRDPRKINNYLMTIWYEATDRGYKFDPLKVGECIPGIDCDGSVFVPRGQVKFKVNHLLNKLWNRAPDVAESNLKRIKDDGYVFVWSGINVIDGDEIADWERS